MKNAIPSYSAERDYSRTYSDGSKWVVRDGNKIGPAVFVCDSEGEARYERDRLQAIARPPAPRKVNGYRVIAFAQAPKQNGLLDFGVMMVDRGEGERDRYVVATYSHGFDSWNQGAYFDRLGDAIDHFNRLCTRDGCADRFNSVKRPINNAY